MPEKLGLVDVFMPNEAEALQVTGTETPEVAMRNLATWIPTAIVKLGRDRAFAMHQGQLYRFPPTWWILPAPAMPSPVATRMACSRDCRSIRLCRQQLYVTGFLSQRGRGYQRTAAAATARIDAEGLG